MLLFIWLIKNNIVFSPQSLILCSSTCLSQEVLEKAGVSCMKKFQYKTVTAMIHIKEKQLRAVNTSGHTRRNTVLPCISHFVNY
jgi:hypothetical protein